MAQSARRTPHAARMPRAARRAPLTLNRSTSAGFRSAAKCRVSEQPRPVSYGKQIFHLALLREIKSNYAYVHENDFGTLCSDVVRAARDRVLNNPAGIMMCLPSQRIHIHADPMIRRCFLLLLCLLGQFGQPTLGCVRRGQTAARLGLPHQLRCPSTCTSARPCEPPDTTFPRQAELRANKLQTYSLTGLCETLESRPGPARSLATVVVYSCERVRD